MSLLRERLGFTIAVVFARVLCPFALIIGNVKWYARCVAKGVELYGRLTGVNQLDFWKLMTIWMAALTLFNDGTSITFKIDKKRVDSVTMHYWQTILYETARMLGYDASEFIDKRAVQMTMYT